MYFRQVTSYKNATIAVQGSIASVSTTSIVCDQYYYLIQISGYYALYNTTFDCKTNAYCYFICEDNSLQLFYINYNFSHSNVYISNCNNKTTNDNITLNFISKISEIGLLLNAPNTSNVTSNYKYTQICDSNESHTFDIGYPFQVEKDIFNSNEGGCICCRGFRSCFGANAVISSLGSILCIAAEACRDTVLLNDYSTSSSTNVSNDINIYCLANSACYGSVMTSESDIYCIAPYSCSNTVMLDAETVYCTKDGCENSKITNVESVHLFDAQSGMTIFSDNIEFMNVYLRGIKAGKDVTIYCDGGDYCTIDCGTQTACNGLNLYCYGKCNVLCNDTAGITCPNVLQSLPPSAAPSSAPSLAPTVPPSSAPSHVPSTEPSNAPTVPPSNSPTSRPSSTPTENPTSAPTCRSSFFCFFSHAHDDLCVFCLNFNFTLNFKFSLLF